MNTQPSAVATSVDRGPSPQQLVIDLLVAAGPRGAYQRELADGLRARGFKGSRTLVARAVALGLADGTLRLAGGSPDGYRSRVQLEQPTLFAERPAAASKPPLRVVANDEAPSAAPAQRPSEKDVREDLDLTEDLLSVALHAMPDGPVRTAVDRARSLVRKVADTLDPYKPGPRAS